MHPGVHFNFDNAWDSSRLELRTIDALALGPHLRYTAPERQLQKAFTVLRQGLGGDRFILYGSGDYHYLSAWWLRAALDRDPQKAASVTLISFDNHPDWDIRPPGWACGGWINRALEFPEIKKASVWGCGNFELAFPSRLFRNRAALAKGALEVHAWAERQSPSVQKKFDCMRRENWRERFGALARSLAGQAVYVTIDMDTLAAEHAATNWENGLFTPADIAWGLAEIRRHGELFAGDCCGAFSPPAYARRLQRFAGNFDHPKIETRSLEESRAINHRSLETLWPALTQQDPRREARV